MSDGPFSQYSQQTIAIKRIYEIQLGKMLQNESESPTDQLVPYFKAKHVLWEGVDSDDLPQMWASTKDLAKYGVQVSDLLVSEGGDVGRSALVKSAPPCSIIQNALHRVRSNRSDVRFLCYALRVIHGSGWLDVLCNKATIAHLTGEKLGELRIPILPLPIQRAIADFLDRKTAAIDALIDKKQKLLDLLAEKRAALINQAVTKGLNPHAPMKDSGIPWIGQIPAHWEVKRLKTLTSFTTSGSRGWAEYYTDDSDAPVFLQSGNLGRRLDIDLSTCQRVSPPSGAEGERTVVAVDDVLVCITGGRTGAVALVSNPIYPKAFINQHVCLIRLMPGIAHPLFVSICLESDLGQTHFQMVQYGGTKQGLGLDDVRDCWLAVPPFDEQNAIAKKVWANLAASNKLHLQIQLQIERLQEYRQAVITAAVTGQVDVTAQTDKTDKGG